MTSMTSMIAEGECFMGAAIALLALKTKSEVNLNQEKAEA
jgi:hypothetical protein